MTENLVPGLSEGRRWALAVVAYLVKIVDKPFQVITLKVWSALFVLLSMK